MIKFDPVHVLFIHKINKIKYFSEPDNIDNVDATKLDGESSQSLHDGNMVILEEEEEENEIDFQREQLPESEGAKRPMPTSFRRISKKKGRKLYSKHKHHSKHRCDLLVDDAYYPRYKIVDYDEDNLKMKLIRVYPRIVDDGDGGGGDVVGIDNGDIVVDGNGGGGDGNGGYGEKKGNLKMKIIFDS